MISNSNSTTPPIRLNGPQESLIQFALKLKNVVVDMCVCDPPPNPLNPNNLKNPPSWLYGNNNPVKPAAILLGRRQSVQRVPMNDPFNQVITARLIQGHRVASGLNANPRFPGGTLLMQRPHFLALGLDIGTFHQGTLNVSIAPLSYRVVKPRLTFRNVQWHPVEPKEDFSFFDVRLLTPNRPPAVGLIYYPHPETKPEHFQAPDVLELLLPFVEGLSYGMELSIEIPSNQMVIESRPNAVPGPR